MSRKATARALFAALAAFAACALMFCAGITAQAAGYSGYSGESYYAGSVSQKSGAAEDAQESGEYSYSYGDAYAETVRQGMEMLCSDYACAYGSGDATVWLYEFVSESRSSAVYSEAESFIKESARSYSSSGRTGSEKCGGMMPDGSYVAVSRSGSNIMAGSSPSGDKEAVQDTMAGYGYWGGSGSVGAVPIILILLASFCVCPGLGCFGMFGKAGKRGWLAFVPIVTFVILCEIAWGRKRVAWRVLIPVVNIVFVCRTQHKLSKAFGHGAPFTVGMIFLTFFFYLVLSYGKSVYLGPQGGRGGENGYGGHGGYGGYGGYGGEPQEYGYYDHGGQTGNDYAEGGY